jgi:hypothetical protein
MSRKSGNGLHSLTTSELKAAATVAEEIEGIYASSGLNTSQLRHIHRMVEKYLKLRELPLQPLPIMEIADTK